VRLSLELSSRAIPSSLKIDSIWLSKVSYDWRDPLFGPDDFVVYPVTVSYDFEAPTDSALGKERIISSLLKAVWRLIAR